MAKESAKFMVYMPFEVEWQRSLHKVTAFMETGLLMCVHLQCLNWLRCPIKQVNRDKHCNRCETVNPKCRIKTATFNQGASQ
jgi:hypothetical protein